MLPILNPTPILFTFAVMFGVLVHDMHIDKATTVAFAPPAYSGSTAAANVADHIISKSEHTHVERASVGAFSSTLPKSQPPRENDRRYIQNHKQSAGGTTDPTFIWPSV